MLLLHLKVLVWYLLTDLTLPNHVEFKSKILPLNSHQLGTIELVFGMLSLELNSQHQRVTFHKRQQGTIWEGCQFIYEVV